MILISCMTTGIGLNRRCGLWDTSLGFTNLILIVIILNGILRRIKFRDGKYFLCLPRPKFNEGGVPDYPDSYRATQHLKYHKE